MKSNGSPFYGDTIGCDDERTAASLGHSRERSIDLAFGAGPEDNELQRKRTCSRLHVAQLALGILKIWIREEPDDSHTGYEFPQLPVALTPAR
jgi:hypothetical protein